MEFKIWNSKLKGFKNGIECRKKDKSLSRIFRASFGAETKLTQELSRNFDRLGDDRSIRFYVLKDHGGLF